MKTKLKVFLRKMFSGAFPMIGGLGVVACSPSGFKPYPSVEYGCPYVEYYVRGTVKDESGNPIEGIRAIIEIGECPPECLEYEYVQRDTVFSDKNGEVFQLKNVNAYNNRATTVYLEDIDGDKHGGNYESLVIKDLPQQDFSTEYEYYLVEKPARSSWYVGTWLATFDAKLKKK